MSLPVDHRRPAAAVLENAAACGRGRVVLLAIFAVAALVLAAGWHQMLSLETLVRHRATINGFIAEHWFAALVGYLALYVGSVALSIPCAAILTICGGVLFGTAVGALMTVIGATAGATVIFLVARSAAGEFLMRRAGPLAEKLAKNFCAEAFNCLLFLRLVPLFPFWIVNLVAAACGVGLLPFVTATALGIIPVTLALAFFGAGLDSALAAQEATYNRCLLAGRPDCRLDFDLGAAFTPELLAALAVLGTVAVLPVVVRRLRRRRSRPSE